MTKEIIEITSRDQWLAERTRDITSTEAAALYGLSPYLTQFELFHQKRDGVVVSFDPNERMRWGTRLEDAIAKGAAEDNGWQIEKLDVYMRDTINRMGSSFDYEITSAGEGRGILEIKNVDGMQYRQNWIDDGNGNIEAPEHIELQIQHQMEVSGYEWTALAALVGGNELKITIRKRDHEIGQDLRARSAAFWASIAANKAPAPDYVADAEYMIKKLYNKAEADRVLEANEMLEDMIKQYNFISREMSDLEKIKDQYRAQILEAIGEASKVTSSIGTISCGMVKPSLGTLITPEMVGTHVGGRSGYRGFRFTAKKDK